MLAAGELDSVFFLPGTSGVVHHVSGNHTCINSPSVIRLKACLSEQHFANVTCLTAVMCTKAP